MDMSIFLQKFLSHGLVHFVLPYFGCQVILKIMDILIDMGQKGY